MNGYVVCSATKNTYPYAIVCDILWRSACTWKLHYWYLEVALSTEADQICIPECVHEYASLRKVK